MNREKYLSNFHLHFLYFTIEMFKLNIEKALVSNKLSPPLSRISSVWQEMHIFKVIKEKQKSSWRIHFSSMEKDVHMPIVKLVL
jgi:hypothetical protein